MNDTELRARPLWRQPLFHFLLAGAAIFAVDAFRGSPDSASTNRVVVSSANIERLADQWQLTWGRPPDEQELQALVRNYVKAEIYYREALKLGLDVNDPVIRQRLGRKMEYLLAGEVTKDAVNDDVLSDYYKTNAQRYQKSPLFDFAQVYFESVNTTEEAASNFEQEASAGTVPSMSPRAERALEQLRAGGRAENFGDRIGLPAMLESADEITITRTFGSEFYSALGTLTTGDWYGPVSSGFGDHLVKITRKVPARIPQLDEVRGAVTNDWLTEQNTLRRNQAFEELQAGYEISIEVSD